MLYSESSKNCNASRVLTELTVLSLNGFNMLNCLEGFLNQKQQNNIKEFLKLRTTYRGITCTTIPPNIKAWQLGSKYVKKLCTIKMNSKTE